MQNDLRGRITVPDVVFIVMSLAVLGALSPVLYDALDTNVSGMSTGEAYLFQMIVPFAVLILLSMVYVKATAGAR